MITIFQGKFFPYNYRVVGFLIPIAVSIKFITNSVGELNLPFYVGALVIGALLLFTEWTLEIYTDKKILRKNLRFLLFSVGSKQSYGHIEKIFINRIKQTSILRPNTRVIAISEFIYKAFIKLDDGEKIMLDCDSDKEVLIQRLISYNQDLKTMILDNTVGEGVWIASEPNT